MITRPWLIFLGVLVVAALAVFRSVTGIVLALLVVAVACSAILLRQLYHEGEDGHGARLDPAPERDVEPGP